MKPKLWIFIYLAFGVEIGGFLILLLLMFKPLSLNGEIGLEINPLEPLTLFITILLTMYVTTVLDKRNEQERAVKDILIEYLTDFRKSLHILYDDLSMRDEIELVKLNAQCRAVRMRANAITSLAAKHGFVTTGDAAFIAIKDSAKKIQDILTNTPKKGAEKAKSSVDETSVKNGKVTLGRDRLAKLEGEIISMETSIFDMVVNINKK